MNALARPLASPTTRTYALLICLVAGLAIVDHGHGRILNASVLFSVLQQFATIGPVALGLGLTMIVREFDLAVGGTLSLAGCLAVIFGTDMPLFGIALAMLAGFASGTIQGAIMVRLNLSSVGVTLGGLLTLGGIAYVTTSNLTIGYDRMDIAMLVNEHVFGVFSIRSLAAAAVFAIAGLVMGWTRLGRDVMAIGGDRRSAAVAGVSVGTLIIGVFAVSGALTALSGALLSYSLAGRPRRCARSSRGGLYHRRRVAVGRQRHASRHCRRGAGVMLSALGPDCDRLAALHARHRDRRCPGAGRAARRRGPGPQAIRGAPQTGTRTALSAVAD